MTDVYPVPCDQVARPLPTPGTDVDIRNKKTKTPCDLNRSPGVCGAPSGLTVQVGTMRGLSEGQGCPGFEKLQKPSIVTHDR